METLEGLRGCVRLGHLPLNGCASLRDIADLMDCSLRATRRCSTAPLSAAPVILMLDAADDERRWCATDQPPRSIPGHDGQAVQTKTFGAALRRGASTGSTPAHKTEGLRKTAG